MSRSISEILAVEDYTQLTHEEIQALIDYKCERAAYRATMEERESGRREAYAAQLKRAEESAAAMRDSAGTYEPPVLKVVQYG